MKTTWKMIVNIYDPLYIKKNRAPKTNHKITLKEITEQLNIPYPLTGFRESDIFLFQQEHKNHYICPSNNELIYFVNTKEMNKNEQPQRILEVVAYGFKDYCAREIARDRFK